MRCKGSFAWWQWSGAMSLVAVLINLWSFRLWRDPMPRLTDHEFDWWVGAWTGDDALFWGKAIGAGLLMVAGLLYGFGAERLRSGPPPSGGWWLVFLGPWVAFAAGWPWVSPDVFYYLGKGWLEAGHGMSAFAHGIKEAPDFASNPLLFNVHPAFQDQAGNYGPVFQWICAGVAWLGGGSVGLTLGWFKVLCAGLLLGLVGMVGGLCRELGRDADRGIYLMAASPLILFTFLTCNHNDLLMVLGLVAAVWAAGRRSALVCGLLLGSVFALKYVSLIVTPLFGLYFLKNEKPPWWTCSRLVLGFGLAAVLPHGLEPEAWHLFVSFAGEGYESVRSSLALLLLGLGWGESEAGFQWMKRSLQLVFIGVWLVLFLAWWRSPRMTVEDLIRSVATVNLLYLLISSTVVVEWYFLWLWPFLVLLAEERSQKWLVGLSVLYLPGTLFTINSPPLAIIAANFYLYLVLLGFSVPLLLKGGLLPPCGAGGRSGVARPSAECV